METVKSNLEHVDDGDAAVAAQRDRHMAKAMFVLRARKYGAIPLDALLAILAGESFREAGRGPATYLELRIANREFDDGYRVLLRHAKRGILSGNLIVRQLPTLAPINEFPVIQSWCNSNDTLKNYDDIVPDGRLVVTIENAVQWLQGLSIPIPNWIHEVGALPSPGQPVKEKPIGQRVRDRNKELKASGNASVIKTLIGEFNKSESAIKKHLYGPKAKDGTRQR